MSSVYSECARLAAGAGAGALASVARRRGSLPMSEMAKLLVTASGARLGTIGGGCLEAEVIERAMTVLEQRLPALSSHTLNAELAGDYGLTCGGTVDIFIQPVFRDDLLAEAWAHAAAIIASGERGAMAVAFDWRDGPRLLVSAGDRTSGARDPALLEAIRALGPHAESPRLEADVLAEPLVGKPRLVVFGAGHVGARIAEAATFAGWRVTVVDDRPEFADPARLPFAERVVTCEFHDVRSAARFDADTYVVIATRGHQHDAVIAAQVAPLPLRYLGMLGSRRKAALTAKALSGWDVAEEAIARMHAPVGVSIGADTPEEIAVSVVAQMIAVRRSGSTRRGGIPAEVAGESGAAT
jgi:xanthine dehydrogenase accessory factor